MLLNLLGILVEIIQRTICIVEGEVKRLEKEGAVVISPFLRRRKQEAGINEQTENAVQVIFNRQMLLLVLEKGMDAETGVDAFYNRVAKIATQRRVIGQACADTDLYFLFSRFIMGALFGNFRKMCDRVVVEFF